MSRLRWLIWLAYVIVWTAGLLAPLPDTGSWEVEELQLDLKYLFGKSLHVAAYAVMTVLSAWLHVAPHRRWLLIFFLMAHASLTEVLQLYVANRSGQLTDVAFDHLGVAVGVVCTWKWWTYEPEA
jgi:VanZ family protein